MNVETILQLGRTNQIKINESKIHTQRVEIQTDLYMSIAFLIFGIFLILTLILFKSSALFKNINSK